MFYGYHRTSTKEQHLDRGIKGIEEFCKNRGYKLEKIYTDKMSGKNMDRPRYTVLKEDVLRKGDTLILYELDRLARNKKAIADELEYFDKIGVRIMFLDIPTTTIDLKDFPDEMYKMIVGMFNKLVIEVYSMQAQAEIERKEKRQREGIQAKKDRGEWENYGRPRKMRKEDFAIHYQRVVDNEIGTLALMRELGLNKDTFFRYVREFKREKQQKELEENLQSK